MSMVDIRGLDKAELLAALYNHASPAGRGMARARMPHEKMTVEEARELLTKGDDVTRDLGIAAWLHSDDELYFDYVHGRPLKVALGGDELDTRLYDRDQGAGEGERVVAELRARTEAAKRR